MNKQEIELLAGHVRQLSLVLPIQDSEFQSVVDANIGKRNAVKRVQAAFDKQAEYRQEMIERLRQAVTQGKRIGQPMPNSRKLSQALKGGLDSPSPLQFIFDCVVELSELAERTKSGSRVQPDHPITKWVRQHGKGRKDSKAVRAYIELHKDSNPKNPKAFDYDKLYQDLQNDKKKHRKHQSD